MDNFQIHSDFVAAAVKGAMAVVDGNVMAINPADDPRTHMYIWNNIFFSLGFDVKDHYQKLGGDAAAFIATVRRFYFRILKILCWETMVCVACRR